MLVSGLSKCLEIRTGSSIFAKPGRIADTLLIPALHCFPSLWLFPMFVLSFTPTCCSRSWASQDLVQPCTPRVLMNAPKASWTTCAMHCMWFLIAGHLIPDASGVDWRFRVFEWFEEALSVVIPSERALVSSKWSRTSFQCMASLAPVGWPLTYQSQWAFEIGKEQAINLVQCKLYFSQCPILIHIICNDWCYRYFSLQCPPI